MPVRERGRTLGAAHRCVRPMEVAMRRALSLVVMSVFVSVTVSVVVTMLVRSGRLRDAFEACRATADDVTGAATEGEVAS